MTQGDGGVSKGKVSLQVHMISRAIPEVFVKSDGGVMSGRSGTVRLWETAFRL